MTADVCPVISANRWIKKGFPDSNTWKGTQALKPLVYFWNHERQCRCSMRGTREPPGQGGRMARRAGTQAAGRHSATRPGSLTSSSELILTAFVGKLIRDSTKQNTSVCRSDPAHHLFPCKLGAKKSLHAFKGVFKMGRRVIFYVRWDVVPVPPMKGWLDHSHACVHVRLHCRAE